MHKHLAILSETALKRIFAGKKTIESRFSQKKIPPFGEVSVGDLVYLKAPGKDISGQFKVSKVISFENMDESDWELINKNYWQKISLGDENLDETFKRAHKASRYGLLIFIENLEQLITSPITYKKRDQRAWVVLE